MALILKVDFNGDVRRFRLELPENADIATKWTMIIEEIRAGCKLAAGDDGFVLKYTDEEGDECTLVKETLSDCLLQAGAGPVRLVSHRHAVPAGEASPAGVPGELDLMASKMIMDFKKIMKACKGKGKGNGKCGWKRHWWPQEGTVEAGKCPYGHGLSKQSLCGVCDKCDTGFSFEDVAMGCRMCNWDLCESCFKEQDPAEETAKDQDANRDAKEASAEAPGISDSEWTAEPPMDSWEAALFTHLHGKGKGKGKGKSLSSFPGEVKVWIGQLAEGTTWKALQTHMDMAGKTKWVEVFEGKGKGRGAVAYATAEEAMAAIAAMNGSDLGGQSILCDVWEKQPKAEASAASAAAAAFAAAWAAGGADACTGCSDPRCHG